MTLETQREKTNGLLRSLNVTDERLQDPKFRLNLVMVQGKDGEYCAIRCPHLQFGIKQSYCMLFGQQLDTSAKFLHVRHQSCLTDPDVKACESYSLGRLKAVETFNASLVDMQ
jgi:hypothetical protein